MMMRVAITRVDGGVSIMETTAEDLNDALSKWKLSYPGYVSHETIDETLIPEDRTFRRALKLLDGKPAHDMPKALELQKERIRRERKPLLEALDVEFARALETADAAKQADIVKRKKALRDLTDDLRLAAATTPDELKALDLTTLSDTKVKNK